MFNITAMGDENQSRDRDFRERIASFIQADQPLRHKQLSEEERQTLKAASSRLDQLLARIAEEERARSTEFKQEEVRALSDAAGRLDRLLKTPRQEKAKS
ncbi:MAG TPA: hypothetical protein VJX16_19395 [Terriglobales bacterium]|nr:hypothetical protein [Terriglobales bacterium]